MYKQQEDTANCLHQKKSKTVLPKSRSLKNTRNLISAAGGVGGASNTFSGCGCFQSDACPRSNQTAC